MIDYWPNIEVLHHVPICLRVFSCLKDDGMRKISHLPTPWENTAQGELQNDIWSWCVRSYKRKKDRSFSDRISIYRACFDNVYTVSVWGWQLYWMTGVTLELACLNNYRRWPNMKNVKSSFSVFASKNSNSKHQITSSTTPIHSECDFAFKNTKSNNDKNRSLEAYFLKSRTYLNWSTAFLQSSLICASHYKRCKCNSQTYVYRMFTLMEKQCSEMQTQILCKV